MGITDRRLRDRGARERLIVAAARQLATEGGWDAVTTRALGERIEYSQPVLYSHFANKQAILRAVALQGFTDLSERLRVATAQTTSARDLLSAVAHTYVDFAAEEAAVYEAMFTLSTDLHFATPETPAELRGIFEMVREKLTASGADISDPDTTLELFWSALHGLIALSAAGRLRPGFETQRVNLLVRRFAPESPVGPAGIEPTTSTV